MTAVSYALRINGAPASPELLNAVKHLEVEDHAEMADMLRLRLAVAVRPDGSGWTIVDEPLFERLTRIGLTVTVGSGPATPLIEAYVVATDATLSSEPDGSTLTVTAMDATVLMHLEEKVRPWPNMADSDVATAVFGDPNYSFSPVVEPTRWTRQEPDQTLVQRGSDIQLLQMLAHRNGYECFVELNPATGTVEGHFHPSRHEGPPQGVLTVNMGTATNVTTFRTRHDMLGPSTAGAATVDVEAGSPQLAEVAAPAQRGLGSEGTASPDRPRRILLSELGMGNAGEVQRFAQAVVDRSVWSIVAEGELNTVAYGGVLRAKRPVLVRGVGSRLSGTYYVEKVLHAIGSAGSYTQRFTLRRNARGLTGSERFESAAP